MNFVFTISKENQQKIVDALEQKRMKMSKEMALAQIANIQLRVANGIGLNGEMKNYSKKYSIYKKKTGRRVNVRNLEFTGRMLSDMGITEIDNGVYVIHFLTAQQRLKALSNQMREAWFGITDEEREMLMKLAKKEVEK